MLLIWNWLRVDSWFWFDPGFLENHSAWIITSFMLIGFYILIYIYTHTHICMHAVVCHKWTLASTPSWCPWASMPWVPRSWVLVVLGVLRNAEDGWTASRITRWGRYIAWGCTKGMVVKMVFILASGSHRLERKRLLWKDVFLFYLSFSPKMTFMTVVKPWEPDLCLYFCFWNEIDVYLILFFLGKKWSILNSVGKKIWHH